MKYVISRNVNGRPTLQHSVEHYRSSITLCGWDISEWTRVFSDKPLGIMLCKRCKEAAKVPVNNATIISMKAHRRSTA